MKYLDYKESRTHGSFEFPFAFYNVTSTHPRYQMIHHWHPEFELIRILKGSLTMQLNGLTTVAIPGDSFFITGGVVHSGVPHNCHYECIVFSMDFFLKEQRCCYMDLLSILHHNLILQHYYPSTQLEENSIFTNIFNAISNKAPGYELIVQGNFYHIFGLALQKNLFQKTARPFEQVKKIKQLETVLSMIQQHYSENITLADMAKSVHMNPNYFCRFFNEIVHQTPIQYLNQYRIECACEKLAASGKSITEVALECGFNDVSYFIKVFKRIKGDTPAVYYKKRPIRHSI